ncbi:universal stress protein [Plantibacter sp. CFBP 8804]|uniref:universal stress protein n=1 Tax=Plantibacter sp. CFBP 8804 TaxID=2775270 RepID=UPI0017874FBD|nr:universal stress protein [Plantibacter sp. CFBP 8804]MBD8516369.1 universal stress protein [Plantibacter sp. CFBP 8804]
MMSQQTRMNVSSSPIVRRDRCIVGFDGSSASVMALDWAVTWAARNHREVHLVGVVDDEAGALGGARADDRDRAQAQLLSLAFALLAERYPGLVVANRLVTGPVASSLAAAARPNDIVVVGADKAVYAHGQFFGVRSVQLAALVSGPLVVVPAADLRFRAGVLVAIDGGPESSRLACIGAEEAMARQCAVGLVHSVAVEATLEQRHLGELVLREAFEAARAVAPGLEISRHLANRRPAEAMLNLARDRALLVMGRSRRNAAPGVGGTLHEVLINANVPVMVLP